MNSHGSTLDREEKRLGSARSLRAHRNRQSNLGKQIVHGLNFLLLRLGDLLGQIDRSFVRAVGELAACQLGICIALKSAWLA